MTTPVPFLDGFDTTTVPYKTVYGHDILADILLPSGIQPGKHPIVINWHGGALVTGSRNFKLFFPSWMQPFASRNSAIVISADYRLIPEASGRDVLEDLESLWKWLHSDFPDVLHRISDGKHQADFSRVIVNGGSAGGWCAYHQAMSHPEIKAIMVQYPSVGLDGEGDEAEAVKSWSVEVIGQPVMSREEVTQHLQNIKPGTVVTEGGMERNPLGLAASVYGLRPQWVGTDDALKPFERVKDGACLPSKLWIMHGTADRAIPVEHTERFAERVQRYCPWTELRVDYFDGQDHGFDCVPGFDAGQIAPALEWIQSAWWA